VTGCHPGLTVGCLWDVAEPCVLSFFIPLEMQVGYSVLSVLADMIPCLGGLCCNRAVNLGCMGDGACEDCELRLVRVRWRKMHAF
jgi:hypothetical protein